MNANKMNIMGIGPRLALITLPYILLSIMLMILEPQFLRLNFMSPGWFKIAAVALIILGFIFYLSSVVVLLKDFGKGKLITRGAYAICRNPLYGSIIVFIIPGIGLWFQSGIIISIAVVLYLNFKLSIHGENIALSRAFGEEYEKYKRDVNEIFPFPKFWQKR